MKELIIDRTKWYRGNGSAHSRLLRSEDNMMCCLGFYSLACGLEPANILGVAFPSNVDASHALSKHITTVVPVEMAWLDEFSEVNDENLEDKIGSINDSQDLTDVDREKYLTEEFANHDIAVTFLN